MGNYIALSIPRTGDVVTLPINNNEPMENTFTFITEAKPQLESLGFITTAIDAHELSVTTELSKAEFYELCYQHDLLSFETEEVEED